MPPLHTFLRNKGQSQLAFSQKHGFVNSNVNRVIRGERVPTVDFARRLSKATGGKVKWTQFFDRRRAGSK